MKRPWLLIGGLPLLVCTEGVAGSQAVPELDLELVVHVDPEARTDSTPLFGRIVALEVGSDGSVFVLDAMNHRVSAFDSTGRFLRAFGRRGQGPGEMVDPIAMFHGPEGDLWIVDAGLGRVTVFTTTGDLVGTRRAVGPRPLDPPRFGFSASGHLVSIGINFQGGSLERPEAIFVEAEIDDESVRQVRQEALPFVQWPDVFEYRDSEVSLMIPVPFSPEPQFAIDPRGRLWYADPTDGTVSLRVGPDRWDRRLGSEFAPVPVREADIERALRDSRDVEELRAVAGDAGIERLTNRIPEVKPRVGAFFFDDGGRVWILRPPVSRGAPSPVEVYASDGGLLATGTLRLAARPHPRVRGDVLVGVARDGFDQETIMVYRIPGWGN